MAAESRLRAAISLALAETLAVSAYPYTCSILYFAQRLARAFEGAPPGKESAEAFKARLRRVAFRTSPSRVRAAVEAMRSRAAKIWQHDGKNILRD